jgi:glutamate synthase domain-containing protein 3
MVDLEALDEEDIELVRGLMERHREYTGSTVADGLLVEWPAVAGKFVKVFPRDYKRAIAEGVDAAKAQVQAAQGQGGNGKSANGKQVNGKKAATKANGVRTKRG